METTLQQLQQRVGDALTGKALSDSQPIDELARRLAEKAGSTGPDQIAATDLVLRILTAK